MVLYLDEDYGTPSARSPISNTYASIPFPYQQRSDVGKALYSVDHSELFPKLTHFGFGSTFCHCIQTFYKDTLTATLINGTSRAFFQISCSVRQGDALPPGHFVVYIELLVASFFSTFTRFSILTPLHPTLHLPFAFTDDVTGLLNDLRQAPHFINRVTQFFPQRAWYILLLTKLSFYRSSLGTKHLTRAQPYNNLGFAHWLSQSAPAYYTFLSVVHNRHHTNWKLFCTRFFSVWLFGDDLQEHISVESSHSNLLFFIYFGTLAPRITCLRHCSQSFPS